MFKFLKKLFKNNNPIERANEEYMVELRKILKNELLRGINFSSISINTTTREREEKIKETKPFIDKRTNICPYCKESLIKIPGAKTKCKSCKEYVYVRTNIDNIKLTVTKDEANKIDEENAIKNGSYDFYLSEKEDKLFIESLLEKFKNDNDFDYFNNNLNEYSENKFILLSNYGFNSIFIFKVAEYLRKEDLFLESLFYYVKYTIFSINKMEYNGILNDEKLKDLGLDSYYNDIYDRPEERMSPYQSEWIIKILKKTHKNKDYLQEVFLQSNFYKDQKQFITNQECFDIFCKKYKI